MRIKDSKISILLLSYNRVEYLPSVLDSILSQSVTPLELVIVEDNSPEKLLIKVVVDDYLEKFNGVGIELKFYSNSCTYGLDKNLREGLKKTNGEYVCILGNDDLLMPNYISDAIIAISEYPDYKCFTRSFQRRDHVTGLILGKSRVDKNLFSNTSSPRPDLIFRSCAFISGLLVDRKQAVAIETEKFDGTLYYQYYLFLKLTINVGVGTIENLCVLATVNNKSEFGAAITERKQHSPGPYKVQARLEMWKSVMKIADSIPYYKKSLPLLANELSRRMSFHVYEMLGSGDRNESYNYFLGMKKIGLKNNTITVALLLINIILGKKSIYIYKSIRQIIQR